ncbi:MAG: hypothetical protein ACU85E_16405 [Gammaproteobacteria bacterium]
MISRRKFIQFGLAVPVVTTTSPGLAQPGGDNQCIQFRQSQPRSRREEYLQMSESLFSQWCEGMLSRQIISPHDTSRHGALWSAGDDMILGRCGDAVYPLLRYAKIFQNERYLEGAMRLMNWSLANVALPDGSWKNEVKGLNWPGITVFIATAMALAIKQHGDILDDKVRNSWTDRLRLSGEWLYKTIDINYGNINYPVANAYAMSLLGRMFDEPKFIERSKELTGAILTYFTEKDGFLFGEGRKSKIYPHERSRKGCYPVDLGYNVEESLPTLAMLGLLEKDELILTRATDALRLHAEFLLPDGGWDNSWGTRNFKWTWWGSRTSDGCQPAYALLADRDPLFLEVAYRNTRLLQECTYNGILYGGPHVQRHGSQASIHHTFCHAKALAVILDYGVPEIALLPQELPCEKSYGVHSYPDISTWIISHRPWRATVTSYDFPYKDLTSGHASGGALSLLWHHKVGPLIAASMSIFHRVEKPDMQDENGPDFDTLTPRVEMIVPPSIINQVKKWINRENIEPIRYMNILDMDANVDIETQSDTISVVTRSSLVNERQQSPAFGNVTCRISYLFTKDNLQIEVNADSVPEDLSISYIIPIISNREELWMNNSEGEVTIRKQDALVRISADRAITLPNSVNHRIFSFIPGFEMVPIRVLLSNDKPKVKLKIAVSET